VRSFVRVGKLIFIRASVESSEICPDVASGLPAIESSPIEL
jgi:hypothetical protein